MLPRMYIINSIAPIFLMIILGKLLRRTDAFPELFFKGLNRFVFWIALPALLIEKTSAEQFDLDAVLEVFLLIAAATILTQVIAWMITRLMKLPRSQAGSFIQGAFRGNSAFIGLPVILYALADIDPGAQAITILVFGPTVILFNALSVITLILYGQEHAGVAKATRTLAVELIKNPLIIACMIGLALQAGNVSLPPFASRTLVALGNASLPLALVSIGAGLSIVKLQGAASPSLIASLLKVAVCPALGFLLAGFLDLGDTELMIAIISLACPTAVASYVMADAMGTDSVLAGRIVALSTLFSAVTIPLVIVLGGLH